MPKNHLLLPRQRKATKSGSMTIDLEILYIPHFLTMAHSKPQLPARIDAHTHVTNPISDYNYFAPL